MVCSQYFICKSSAYFDKIFSFNNIYLKNVEHKFSVEKIDFPISTNLFNIFSVKNFFGYFSIKRDKIGKTLLFLKE